MNTRNSGSVPTDLFPFLFIHCHGRWRLAIGDAGAPWVGEDDFLLPLATTTAADVHDDLDINRPPLSFRVPGAFPIRRVAFGDYTEVEEVPEVWDAFGQWGISGRCCLPVDAHETFVFFWCITTVCDHQSPWSSMVLRNPFPEVYAYPPDDLAPDHALEPTSDPDFADETASVRQVWAVMALPFFLGGGYRVCARWWFSCLLSCVRVRVRVRVYACVCV